METRRSYDRLISTMGFLILVRWHLSLQWRHNERQGVSNHRRLHCLFNCLFRRRSRKTSKPRLCVGNSPVTDECPTQKASNAENVCIWWRHRVDWIRALLTMKMRKDLHVICNDILVGGTRRNHLVWALTHQSAYIIVVVASGHQQ